MRERERESEREREREGARTEGGRCEQSSRHRPASCAPSLIDQTESKPLYDKPPLVQIAIKSSRHEVNKQAEVISVHI